MKKLLKLAVLTGLILAPANMSARKAKSPPQSVFMSKITKIMDQHIKRNEFQAAKKIVVDFYKNNPKTDESETFYNNNLDKINNATFKWLRGY